MEQADFNGQIEKHRARVKKYNTVSGIIGIVKAICALLLVFCVVLSFYFMFSGNLRAKMVIWCLIAGASLVAIWIYHDKIRDKIKHSNDMISINKRHIDRISDIESANDISQPYLYSDEFIKRQTTTASNDRDTGFSYYYEKSISRDDASSFRKKPVEEQEDPELFAKATAIKFLLM